MEATFQFEEVGYEPVFRLDERFGYLNGSGVRKLFPEVTYLQIKVDPARSAVYLKEVSEPGRGVYKVKKGGGLIFRLRSRLLKSGLPLGDYRHLGEGIFQHVDFINEGTV